jgi:DNA-binding NarL/FixJ family response regulator
MILTTFDDDEYVHKALFYGAVGYVLKNILPEQLISAIKVVNNGSLLISSSAGSRIIREVYLADEKKKERDAEVNRLLFLFNTLSKREGEVLDLLLQAFSNSVIAEKLYITEQTVKNHISTIYSKLGTCDRFQTIQRVKNLLADTSGK